MKRRNQNSYSLGLTLWEKYYRQVLDAVPEDRRIVTHYDTFFTDPVGELGRLCDFVGLLPAELAVREDLRHHTVGVSLAEAGIGASAASLYDDLVREAGLQPSPSASVDEAHVRRLVLDGAVAQRHADQRQQAIERLEERLEERLAEQTEAARDKACLLYTSPSPRDATLSRMPSSA